MLMENIRPKPEFKNVTDKIHWTQPEIPRVYGYSKSKSQLKKSSESHGCDTPDQGGGKPGHTNSRCLRPKIYSKNSRILNTKNSPSTTHHAYFPI